MSVSQLENTPTCATHDIGKQATKCLIMLMCLIEFVMQYRSQQTRRISRNL